MHLSAATILLSLSAVVWIMALRWRTGSEDPPEGRWRRWIIVLAAVAVSAATYGDIIARMFGTPGGYVRSWNLFHYYLGAKYFEEMGYWELYACALQADRELDRVWRDATPVRDLRTYRIVQACDLPPCKPGTFSDERWREFKQDLRFIQNTTLAGADGKRAGERTAEEVWPIILTDKGFNPTPVWTAAGRLLTNLIPLDNAAALKLLLSLDAILLAVALCFVGRVYGLETALLILIYLVTFWGTYRRFLGMILQHGWLSALLIAVCFFKLGRFRWSAAFFACAIMTRLFPVLIVSGLALRFAKARKDRKDRKAPEAAHSARFMGWLALFCLMFFAVSLLLPDALDAWAGFVRNMRVHASHLHGEVLNVGLKNLLVTCCSGEFRGGFLQVDRFQQRRFLYYPLAAVLLLLYAAFCLRRKNTQESILALGYVPVFAMTTLSRYYYCGLALLLFPRKNRAGLAAWLLGMNLAFQLTARYVFVSDQTVYYPYWIAQGAILVLFLILIYPWPTRASRTS